MNKFLCSDYLVLIMLTVLFAVNSHNSYAQSVEEKFSKANSLMFENKINDALRLYNELIKETSDSLTLSYVFSYGGSCYENQGNDSMALQFYRNAILYKTGEYAIFNKLYSLAKKQKNTDNQEFALKSKIAVFPSEKENSLEKLAYLYAGNRQFDKIIQTTNQLLEIDSTRSNYYYLQGFGFENLGENEKAESSYRKAIELDPEDYANNLSLGFLLYNKATVAFDAEQSRYSKIKEPNWRHHMTYMDNINGIRGIYQQAKPYLERACNIKSTDQLKMALEKIESRCKKE